MTWERYFYRELLKSASLFLVVFYGLYALVDYSSHLSGAHYHHSSLNLLELMIHYFCEFSTRAEILIPFSLLIGTIHTLIKLNRHSELIALLASGYSLRRLMRPYLISGLIGVFILYFNNEMLLPIAAKKLNKFDEQHATTKSHLEQPIRAHHLTLEDRSTLIYRSYDQANRRFQEVYWIPAFNSIWRMRTLDPFQNVPIGAFVDHFILKNDVLTYDASYSTFVFTNMHFDLKTLSKALAVPDQLSITTLLEQAPKTRSPHESEKAARILTTLYRKLTLPWLALIAVIGPAPFCLIFSRRLPVFLIFAGSIFGLVAIYLFIDAATVLGERQVITPFAAICIPMGFFLSFFLYRFIRMRT